MSSENAIRFAGDVTIEKLELVSLNGFGQDVTNQIVAFEIYEDIFSPFITGTLALRESIDYAGLFPLVGEEYINIRIKTPTFDDKNMMIDDQFFIYKMTNRNMVGDRNVIYELHFISREAIVDMNKRISKSYEGNISDLAKEILSDKINGLETSKNILIEPTENSTKYISNYWSPVKNLNFLAECAKNGKEVPNYLFFENRYGFNFGSLDTLSLSGIKQSFTYDQYYRQINEDGTSIRNIEEQYKRIIEIDIPMLFDYIDNVQSGMLASRQITHDLTTKKYKSLTFDSYDYFEKHNSLNGNRTITSKGLRAYNSFIMQNLNHWGNFNGYHSTGPSYSAQKRISLLKQAQQNKITITVPGRMDYTVGEKIFLNLNKFNPIKDSDNHDDIVDKIFTGQYLISSINHVIDREKHECVMEVIKDSYIFNLENE